MAGSIEGIKRALEAVADRQLCEFGRPGPDGGTRVPVTGAIILGVLDAFEGQVAKLRTERDEAVALLEDCDLFLRIHGGPRNELKTDVQDFLARYDAKKEGDA